jgi:hypothetical protein
VIRTWALIMGLLLAASMLLTFLVLYWVLGEKKEPGLRVENHTDQRLTVGALKTSDTSERDLMFVTDINSQTDTNTGYNACISSARWVAFNEQGRIVASFNPRQAEDCEWNMTWEIE